MHPTVEKYFDAEVALLEYFGIGCPYEICSHTEQFWYISDSTVYYADDEDGLEDYYSNDICGSHTYRKEEHTAVVVFSDFGGKYIMILDNTKEVKQDA